MSVLTDVDALRCWLCIALHVILMYSERMRLCLICTIDAQTRLRLVLEKNNVLVRLCPRVFTSPFSVVGVLYSASTVRFDKSIQSCFNIWTLRKVAQISWKWSMGVVDGSCQYSQMDMEMLKHLFTWPVL